MSDHAGNHAGNTAGEVRDEDAFDVDAVERWLDLGPITGVTQFPGGASNLTYRLTFDGPDGGTDRILRRPPAGTKARGAHDMGREYRIQAALAPVFPQVPAMVAHCEDEAVIGAEFYVMDEVDGVIPRRDLGFELDADGADRLCSAALDVLVALHSVDVASVPDLAALSKGEGYVQRQVGGWTRRFEAARTDDTGDWSDVLAWIDERRPADVAQVMIHNDFRFDNLVLDRHDPTRVVGVLDWEMATVGDPLMDLGSTTAYWIQADDDAFLQSFRRQPTNVPGMWTRDELVRRYCAATGREVTPGQWLFYDVFGVFRLAVIAQQIWYRYVHGQTTNESLASFGPAVAQLERRCRSMIADGG